MGSKHANWAEYYAAATPMNSASEGAGGTGIKPAPCGFGDPIRRVGWYREMSSDATLPPNTCCNMPLNVAVCRWFGGQNGGQLTSLIEIYS